MGVVPHNPLGPVLLLTCLHLSAVTHGVPILEYPGEAPPAIQRHVHGSPRRQGGYLPIPSGVGLGATVVADGAVAGGYDRVPLRNSDGVAA